MINSKIILKKNFIIKKLQELLLNNRYINMLSTKLHGKDLLIEENMIIRYILLPEAKSSAIEDLLEAYIQRNFIKDEKLRFNYNIVSLRGKERGILLYCIRLNVEVEKLLSSHKNMKVIPFQEYIYKKVIRKYPKEEKILAFYFGTDGRGIFNIIYKKQLIYTSNINEEDLERIGEIIDDGCNHIKNICSIKKEDWTVIFINKTIDKVKNTHKNIKEMMLLRSC